MDLRARPNGRGWFFAGDSCRNAVLPDSMNERLA
jgi:hypothetical protein